MESQSIDCLDHGKCLQYLKGDGRKGQVRSVFNVCTKLFNY